MKGFGIVRVGFNPTLEEVRLESLDIQFSVNDVYEDINFDQTVLDDMESE
jgi:hypothetical protein